MLSNQEIALHLDQAAKNASTISQISLKQELSLDQAYQIQDLSIQQRLARGEELLGYKLGFTSKAKMEQMGVHEIIWGRLTSKMDISKSKQLDLSQFIHPRVEPEIAFKLKQPIDKVLDRDNVYDYIDGVTCALEVIDSRYENFKFSLEDVIADNCSSTAFITGEWKDISTRISELPIRMSIDGTLVQEGNSNDILGSPINSLIEFSKLVQKYKVKTLSGMTILAGAATPASFIAAKNVVKANFDHLESLELTVI